MDRQRGERFCDQSISGSQRNSQSDESVSSRRNHQDNPANSPADHHFHHEHYNRSHFLEDHPPHHSSSDQLNDLSGSWEHSCNKHTMLSSGRKRSFSQLSHGASPGTVILSSFPFRNFITFSLQLNGV